MLRSVPSAIKILCISVLCVLTFQAKAGHASSNEVTYRWIDTLTYEVTFVYYRNCAGIKFSNPSSTTKVVCRSSGSSVGLSLTLISIKELTSVCDTLPGQCSGTNQSRSGSGMEVHIYRDTVDFRTSKYNNLVKSGCTDLRFETGLCCRPSNITTGAANKNLYNYADLSIKDGLRNSSPVFALPARPFLYCNQPVYYSVGAIDTIDGDSLSYGIVQPKSSSTTTISVNYPPFTVYYPGSLKYPYTNPNTNPPIGFYFYEETGHTIFTPTKCDEVTTMVYEVKEWRKDTSGKYVNIGVVRRDMMYLVSRGPNNNPPILKSARSYAICEGDSFCVQFKTDDDVFVPPPPQTKPDSDTTKIGWNRGIPGAHFSVVDSTALYQTGKFCWKPEAGSARSWPYQFDIAITDNHCPFPALSYYPIQIKVNPVAIAKTQIDSIGCGMFFLQSFVDSTTNSIPKYIWDVLDINGKILIDARAPIFSSTNFGLSFSQKDTLRFRKAGTYVIRHTLNNTVKCPTIVYDTVVVPTLMQVSIAHQLDTFICQGSSKALEATVLNSSNKISYDWSTSDTTQTINLILPDSIKLETLSIVVTDTTGCIATDAIQIINRPRPSITEITDMVMCQGDSIDVKPTGSLAFWDDPRDPDTSLTQQGSSLEFSLYENGNLLKSDTVFRFKTAGAYYITVRDSLSCTDTALFEVNWPPGKGLKNIETCNIAGASIDLRQFEDSKDSGGIWYCPSYKKVIRDAKVLLVDSFDVTTYSITNSIYFSYKHLGNGCELLDSFKVTVHPLPQLKLQDLSVCQRSRSIDVIEDSVIVSPRESILRKGRQTWSCVDCKTYNQSNIIQDEGTGTPGAQQDFQIYIDPFTIPLKTKNEETLVLDMMFEDENGCKARDTTTIKIGKSVTINFDGFPDLCWDEGIIDLESLSKVSPSGGFWTATNGDGFAKADSLNQALSNDTLHTNMSTRPDESSFLTYLMRYRYQAPSCLITRDTTLTIRGLPEPLKDTRFLATRNDSTAPYAYCEVDTAFELKPNYRGGTWTSSNPDAFHNGLFSPDRIKTLGTPITLTYAYVDIYGCKGIGEVEIEIGQKNEIDVSPSDTSFSWYDENMKLNVVSNPNQGSVTKWEALNTGSFENEDQRTTNYLFGTDKEVSTPLIVSATTVNSNKACPSDTAYMNIFVHRTPCIDFTMDLDLSTKILKLTPDIDSLASYRWTVRDSFSQDVNALIDVTNYTDSLVNVRLHTHNKAGDDCYTDKVINLKNGSIDEALLNPIQWYPNPVHSGFYIKTDAENYVGEVLIYAMDGKLVKSTMVSNGYVSCPELPPGVYSFRIENGSSVLSGKFVKD
jgi:hypothetical protein